jgi:hypothetical protein
MSGVGKMADWQRDVDADSPPDAALMAAGWERRFVADPIRAREAAALYESLGFDVHAEPLKPTELGAQCEDCQLIVCHTYVTLYTRKAECSVSPSGGQNVESFPSSNPTGHPEG